MDKYSYYLNLAKQNYYNHIKNSSLFIPINYILNNSGKNLRPNLIFASCEYFNIELSDIKNIALAIELIHTYSLIHDDLPCMDNDDYRRGKLTLHKVYDDAIATLTGDSLLSDAFMLITNSNIHEDTKVKLIYELSNCIGSLGMVDGQVLDINCKLMSKDDIIDMYKKKTGKLFAFSLSLPAIILEDKNKHLYYELGELLGICFQIKDDIDEFDNSKKESYFIAKYGLDYVKNNFDFYKEKVNKIISTLSINKESNLYKLLIKIRG